MPLCLLSNGLDKNLNRTYTEHCLVNHNTKDIMKIGFSFGRCIRDIVNGDVSIDDVAFIIGATAMREEEQMLRVVEDYMFRSDYLEGLDEVKCKEVATLLFTTGRLLQPRLQGIHRHKQPEGAIWVDIFPTVPSTNESVKASWEQYRFMLHMVENVDNEAIEAFK